ncbi:BZ3500_MvSof-1268-A1-R1_Chr5-2g07822 [Microbotryum saponariae]|uniref:BZ3500_MvSof-1268-A1-R1_Chr5-2g07822 protein n=1 Tax=Microbotryum saponariae TaxID=289078 RepID=A0A2X0KMD1_9BASI|nr:BZ3500_MvSof-1268-A1-R1_Chr5-2g07822 [Microbotryum saponariae]SDA05691.1 BZ3501_MvSof-1269-A2-R1_Chr5-2g07644 [Microbotryum saponariae]
MTSNTASPNTVERTSFDTVLARSLLPSIIALSQSAALLHSAPSTTTSDPTSTAASKEAALNAAKSDLGRQASPMYPGATQLRNALATLQTQAQHLEMGDLSIQDQSWIIKELQLKLDQKRDQVKALRDVIPTPQATSTDQAAMDTSS